jgi:hypothetical protein
MGIFVLHHRSSFVRILVSASVGPAVTAVGSVFPGICCCVLSASSFTKGFPTLYRAKSRGQKRFKITDKNVASGKSLRREKSCWVGTAIGHGSTRSAWRMISWQRIAHVMGFDGYACRNKPL